MIQLKDNNFIPVDGTIFEHNTGSMIDELRIETEDPTTGGGYILEIIASIGPASSLVPYGKLAVSVVINDPCYDATLTIDPSILSSYPTSTTIDYVIGDPMITETFDKTKITSSDTSGNCPDIQVSFWEQNP